MVRNSLLFDLTIRHSLPAIRQTLFLAHELSFGCSPRVGTRPSLFRMFTGVFNARASRHASGARTIDQALRQILESPRLRGLRFRRRQTIGPFIVDAVCAERALVIQIDREHPAFRASEASARIVLLERMGYRVLRIWSQDLLKHPRRVADAIGAAVC